MSLFTVEQLELIRRLRATGCTSTLVIEAFDQLQKMEEDALEGTSTAASTVPATAQQQQPASDPTKEESPSPILLQHLKAQNPVAVTISAASSRFSPDRLTVQTVPPASEAEATVAFPRFDSNAGGRPIRSLRLVKQA